MKILISLLILVSAYIQVSAQTTVILQPGPEGKDVQLWSINPGNNYGDSQKFACMAWTHSGEPGVNRALIDFDLSTVPEGAEILEARLNLYFVCLEPTYFGHTGNNEAFLRLITEPWDELGTSYSSQPSTTTVGQVFLPQSSDPYQDYTDIEVTALIKKIFEEPDNYHGLMLRLNDENPYNCLLFASGDYTQKELRPKLEIVYRSCEPPVVSFTYNIEDQFVNFTGISPTAGSWFWDFGDSYYSSLQNPVHEYQAEGSYEVCLHVEDSCGEVDYCETVDVCDRPVAEFSYQSEELTVYFSDTSHFADGCFWDLGDGYYSDLPDPWHTYDTSGYYYVCLRTWNDCGSDTLCKVVFVDFSGLGDGVAAWFSVYPNPAAEKITVSASIIGEADICIIDVNGREKIKFQVDFNKSEKVNIDVSNLPPGFYIIRIASKQSVLIQKIIISD